MELPQKTLDEIIENLTEIYQDEIKSKAQTEYELQIVQQQNNKEK